jgi:hypothetical protein
MTDDKVALLLSTADSMIRDALHIYETPEWPSDIYDRCGAAVDLLAKLREVATRLEHLAERAPAMWDSGAMTTCPQAPISTPHALLSCEPPARSTTPTGSPATPSARCPT